MGRPPLPLGTYGRVLYRTAPGGRVKARVKFRDFDGPVRLVSKTGSSRAAAERALKEALTSRRTPDCTTVALRRLGVRACPTTSRPVWGQVFLLACRRP